MNFMVNMFKNKKLIIVGIQFILLLIACFIIYSPMGAGSDITVKISKGSTANDVASVLVENKVIRSAFAFKILVRIKKSAAELKPGAYIVNPSMTPSEIIDKIVKGDSISKWLTIPEGYTIKQIAAKIEKEKFGKASEFIRITAYQGDLVKTDLPGLERNLEGYLFPDTYLISMNADEKDIAAEMLRCFYTKVYEPLLAEIAASGFNLNEIIIIASLIEREAKVPADRMWISSVIRNRLKKNMRLAIDATVLYALGEHKNRVYYKDLKFDSPYNTYMYSGLPPGPIANPGIESIKAALHPAESDYLFYVAKPDGSHVFSNTFEEHQIAINEIRKTNGD